MKFFGKSIGVGLSRKAAWSMCKKKKEFYISAYYIAAKECGVKNAKPEFRTVKLSNGKCEIVKLEMTNGFISYFFWVEIHNLEEK